MASNDQWPPVASTCKGAAKVNGNKRNIKDSQQKILSVVNEMFGSALEPQVILTVVQNCNWELQPSIEGLITLTETVDVPLGWNNTETCNHIASLVSVTALQSLELEGGNKKIPTNELMTPDTPEDNRGTETALPLKYDKPKRGGTKNRMGSFCGNIAKLKSSGENNASSITESVSQKIEQKEEIPVTMDDDFIFDDILNYGALGVQNISDDSPKLENFGDFPGLSSGAQTAWLFPLAGSMPPKLPSPQLDVTAFQARSVRSSSPPLRQETHQKQKFSETKAAAEKKEFSKERKVASLDCKTSMRKPESESLCGLKVQYRISGMESSSDDDADVVIEDEASDYKINLAPSMLINVSQFLSPPTQTPPQRTQPDFFMISTPSPPRTPQQNMHDITLKRINSTVQKGHKIMVLLRGLPGSGKSTLAKSIVASTVGGNSAAYIFSTDDFFVTLGRGVYQFDPSRLQDAHNTNHKRVWNAVKEGRSPVIVDNTNIQAWEMQPYAAMAVENGYIVEILEPNTPWAKNIHELAKKNTHNVRKSKIREKAREYEQILSGKYLLEKFCLKYSLLNNPPQLRLVPAMKVDVPKVTPIRFDSDNAGGNHEKNNYVLTSHDIESMQNIDEAHSFIGSISERASVATDSSESSSNPEKAANFREDLFNDYLQVLQDSDDESFEMLEGSGSEQLSDIIGKTSDSKETYGSQRSLASAKLSTEESAEELVVEVKNSSPIGSQQIFGAIGSERKGSQSVGSNAASHENDKSEKNILSPGSLQQALGAIGSERKGSLSVRSSVGNLASDKSETKDSNGHQLPLGAIGSERKGSFSMITSVGNLKAKKPENIKLENEKADKNYDNDWDVEVVINKDISEDLESEDGTAESMNDGILSVEKKKLNLDEEGADLEKEAKNDETQLGEDTVDTHEAEEEATNIEIELFELCGALSLENRVESNSSVLIGEKIEEATEVTEGDANEVPESMPNAGTAFGTLLNMLKTSIFDGAEEASSNDLEDANLDESGSSIYETAVLCSPPFDVKDSDRMEDLSKDTVDNPSRLEKFPESDSYVKIAPHDTSAAEEKSGDTDDKIYADVSTNPFREVTMKSRDEKLSYDNTVILTDNINSISWRESPFPIDGAKIPILIPLDDNETVQKIDAFTNTTYYDFNVAYVGGTSEPGYRELSAVSRCINQGPSIAKLERPPKKWMLDKSSMTNEVDILATEPNLNIEKEKDSSNRIQKLVELFPNIPIDSLTAFYNQECKGNFDWAVEVLLEDVPVDFTIKRQEKKLSIPDDFNSVAPDSENKSNVEFGKLKQRSQSSSPRHRRQQRTNNFRSLSMEYVENRSWASVEPFIDEQGISPTKDNEAMILDWFYDEAASATNLPNRISEIPAASSSSTASGLTEPEDDVDDLMELDFGRDFVNQLEKTFGNTDFTFPDEFKPVIRIKKSMAEQLHALWIQSMYDQLNERHAKLDEMIAKDEEIARELDREETVQPTTEHVVPNLEEIMDMEMALAFYKNELKEMIARETPNDMASRLSRRMLYELLPDIDPQILSEILKAHDGNFKETCEIIETSTGRTISKSDSLQKQQSLLDRVKEERKNRQIQVNSEDIAGPIIVVKPDVCAVVKADKLRYNAAVTRGEDARKEAEKQFYLRIENVNKAAEAYRKGHPAVAAYYSQMAKLHSENIKAAHAEATDASVSAHIYCTDEENTLDLHNLFVSEALLALDRFLDIQSKKLGKSNKKSSILYIITGRGARSNNGLSRIKPAVSKKLICKNIRFTETNPGCLKVTLNKKNGILE